MTKYRFVAKANHLMFKELLKMPELNSIYFSAGLGNYILNSKNTRNTKISNFNDILII